MRRRTRLLGGLAIAALFGCHHDKHQLACKFPDEYTLPPDEPRFNNPPESGYKPRPQKKSTNPAQAAGGAGPSGFGMGGPGMGGTPGGGAGGGFNSNGIGGR
jgi:hypothetical protein